jgi:hypothetical protein
VARVTKSTHDAAAAIDARALAVEKRRIILEGAHFRLV